MYSYFSYFSTKTCNAGTHEKGPTEAILMSTNNIGIHGEIRKNIFSGDTSYLEL